MFQFDLNLTDLKHQGIKRPMTKKHQIDFLRVRQFGFYFHFFFYQSNGFFPGK